MQLPRLYIAWITPSLYAPGDAALDLVSSVLTGGKNSRVYKRLVYEMQAAQSVQAYQGSMALASTFVIEVTPRPGHTIEDLQKIVDEEIVKLQQTPPAAREVERAMNQYEASFYNRMERVGGFGGKADQLNAYLTATGNPDWFNEDLARYRALSPKDISAAATEFLPLDRRIELHRRPGEKADERTPPPHRARTRRCHAAVRTGSGRPRSQQSARDRAGARAETPNDSEAPIEQRAARLDRRGP